MKKLTAFRWYKGTNNGRTAQINSTKRQDSSIKPWRMEKNDYLNGIKTVRTMMA